MRLYFIIIFCAFSMLGFSQKAINTSTLTIEQIMKGDDFIGYSPTGISWSEDSKTIYFSWNPEMDTLRSLYKVNIADGKPMKVGIEEQKMLPSGGVYNKDGSRKLFTKNGDIFIMDTSSGEITQITNTVDAEFGAQFSGDETKIIYNSGGNLFTISENGIITQLTNFRRGNKRDEPRKTANEQFLEAQQMELFDILRERKAERELQQTRNKELQPKRPYEYYYGDKNMSSIQASPDLKFITFRLTKSAPDKRTDVPNYVTESGATEDLRARPKVGSPQDTYEFGIYDIEKDTVYLVDTKQIPGIYNKPAFLKDYHKGSEPYKDQYEKPREVSFFGPLFSEDSKAVVNITSQDNKDRWIMLLDLPTGKLKLLDHQHDDAWIGGPGVGWFGGNNLGWLADNKTLYFQSEKTGYSHLYLVDVISGEQKALTNGKFEIRSADLSHDKQYFYITANAEGPHEQHFYKLSVNGGKLEKITDLVGNNEVTLSPNEQYLAVRYSYSNKPWELYVMENRAGAQMKQITQSTTAEFNKYKWRDPEIVWFKASDGVEVPARIYRPAKPKKGGPAVIFVHGAGYLQNVHKWWSSYSREYMFHNLLADNGYTVLDIDYRASDGYGRDWRTAIYRYMGGRDLQDQVDGAKFLVNNYNIGKDKIGIYGGSYGGFITLMALFTSPGTFKSAAGLRSVTDWAHYNHGYTNNILNSPQEDSIAYHRSSPINFAEGLKDNLLILHGMVDVNVHFQDVVRLSQRLIELKKDNWEFAVYPLEDHGFVEPSSWTDEYKRIFKLFQETLK
ncbi:MAG: prolyl oligopeptidase family serine peptidase [Saprospiraceae bacterium]|nr:prolyl oligopeptidase family serine peptidase [Saprospiraceae bacterium]